MADYSPKLAGLMLVMDLTLAACDGAGAPADAGETDMEAVLESMIEETGHGTDG